MDWDIVAAAIAKEQKERPTMDIRSKSGTKVVFAYPDNGRDYEQKQAKDLLKVGEQYTVKQVYVGQSSSHVEFLEVEGLFNTVLFKEIEEENGNE